jgi:hypothetical protein
MNLSGHFSCSLPVQSNRFLALHTLTLKMEAACSSKSSVSAYKTTRYHILGYYNLNNHCCENLITDTGIIMKCNVQSGECKSKVRWRLHDGYLEYIKIISFSLLPMTGITRELNLWPVHANIDISDLVHLYCQR